ncbi:small ribosomal subunit Rsm22 family protein [Bradyrhizobium sp. LHD-71]|uniref:small ribosomal subunit Rsm22 family protein n=1 Tax=Bradyrhizobium sp. LHD-71 TaxID=3072141 RepID=UPI00280DA8F7|nr:small ribosomal subunit Rsm22 family protein [Bradyrhizobium sp. LHD-71]MDQ8730734.1 small ribosomal subunit Rsm22 family protein [Bradyrhizobium sp. LHD-71]
MNGLPDSLRGALARLSEGLSRRELAERAKAISDGYRSGGTSKPITEAHDALAYALVRMPATYAAVSACLTALTAARPDFAPVSIVDAGAGPGTAAWAAAGTFSSLSDILLLDTNAALTELARTLVAGDARLSHAGVRLGDVRQSLANAPTSDLVIASYLIGELEERQRTELADLMWERTGDTLLVVETGTPAGYRRIIELRAQLIAKGAHVLAPCPHDGACPLVAPDWCHFAQRLPRSRDHLKVKDAEVPFEDEKFSYVALSRVPAEARASRVLAPPRVGKAAVAAKLCTPQGVLSAEIARRDKPAYAQARRWRWGDAVSGDFVD